MERLFFEIEDADGCNLRIVTSAADDLLHLSCENDWMGDTETGFGAVVSMRLERENAERLRAFLTNWLSA